MNIKVNNLLFGSTLLSIAHGFWIFAALFTSIPLLFNLNDFSDSNLQPDTPGTYSIIEMGLAAGSFLIGAVGSLAVMGSRRRLLNSTGQFTLGAFYAIFSVIQLLLLFFRLNKLGVLYDWGWNDGKGSCKDSSFTGCPIARLLSDNTTSIKSISDCKFNAFDVNNINTGAGASQLVDWSNVFNYDAANSQVLATAANSGGTLNVDAAAMPLIHDCWYWGCNEICHPRYKLNRVWVAYAIVSAVVYIILMSLSFAAGDAITKDEELGEGKRSDDETDPLVAPDDDGESGESLIELGSKATLSSSKSLNFNFRM